MKPKRRISRVEAPKADFTNEASWPHQHNETKKQKTIVGDTDTTLFKYDRYTALNMDREITFDAIKYL